MSRVLSVDALRGVGIFVMIMSHVLAVAFFSGQEGAERAAALGLLVGQDIALLEPAPSWLVLISILVMGVALVSLLLLRPKSQKPLLATDKQAILKQALLIVLVTVAMGLAIVPVASTPRGVAEGGLEPLATPVMFFFFVTGVALVLSVAKRKDKEGIWGTARHVILRYGTYIVVGLIVALTLLPSDWLAFWKEPVAAIGLTDLVAFPLLYVASWQACLGIAGFLAAAVPFLVFSPAATLLPGILDHAVILGPFSLLKTLPVVLVGGAIGKSLSGGRSSTRRHAAMGAAAILVAVIAAAFFPIRTTFGMYYYTFFLTTVGLCLLILAAAEFFAGRKVPLTVFTVPGQAALLLYAVHFALIRVLGQFGILTGLSLAESLTYGVLSLALLWMLGYRYLGLRSSMKNNPTKRV